MYDMVGPFGWDVTSSHGAGSTRQTHMSQLGRSALAECETGCLGLRIGFERFPDLEVRCTYPITDGVIGTSDSHAGSIEKESVNAKTAL
jgi:hypothetical protein